MQILVPVPKRLAITQGMVEDFLCDPVLAARVVLGVDLDAFQKARLRYYWWVPNGVDSSGFSSGKTIVDWIYVALRCLLIPDHHAGVYYPTFETGKLTFWTYFGRIGTPIYRAQIGRTEEEGSKTKSEGPACFRAYYRNGSVTLMPAPSFVTDARTQASLRLNTLLVEEWTHVDAMGDGINKQLLGRVTRPSWNQFHPIWANHIHFTAPAKDSMHPGYPRYKVFRNKVKRGDPLFFNISYSFKDYSTLPCPTGKTYQEEYRIESQLATMKASLAESEWLGEGLGVWAESGRAFYPEEILQACMDAGRELALLPMTSRKQDPEDGKREVYYFLGIDPAPAQGEKSDDGGFVVLRATEKAADRRAVELTRGRGDAEEEDERRTGASDVPGDWDVVPVYARRMRNAGARQWSGLIHLLHQRFGFGKVGMDPGGGGQWIMKELAAARQLIEGMETMSVPIVTADDTSVMEGQYILVMVKRGDPGIESMWPDMQGDDVLVDRQHTVMQEALRNQYVKLLARFREIPKDAMAGWGEERVWAARCLTEMVEQFKATGVLTKEDGTLDLTKNVARKFKARGKKDLMSACLNGYTAFLSWLTNNTSEHAEADEEMIG